MYSVTRYKKGIEHPPYISPRYDPHRQHSENTRVVKVKTLCRQSIHTILYAVIYMYIHTRYTVIARPSECGGRNGMRLH